MKEDKLSKHWKKMQASTELKMHDPWLSTIFGGTDTGCRKARIEAGIKKKGKRHG